MPLSNLSRWLDVCYCLIIGVTRRSVTHGLEHMPLIGCGHYWKIIGSEPFTRARSGVGKKAKSHRSTGDIGFRWKPKRTR
jgi:hypothetical protein